MSRSNPNEELKNPASRFYEWSGSKGIFSYYDKVEKKKIDVDLPFTFLVLATYATVKGFNDSLQSGYWGNEVKDVKKDLITVRSKNGKEMTGTWEQIKEKMASDGVDYCQSVYIATKEGGVLKLSNIQMKGSALGKWIEFCKANDIMKCGVTVKAATQAKKGATKYFEPSFEAIKVSDKTNAEAVELDKELQEYMKSYFAKGAEENTSTEKLETPVTETKAEAKTETHEAKATTHSEVDNSNPFADDTEDLPF